MTFPINAYSPCVNPDRRRQPCHPPPMPCPAPPHRAPPSPTPPKRGVGPQRRSAHDARNLVDIRTRQTGVRLRPNSTIPPPSRAPWPPRSSSARRSSSSRRSTTPASPSSTPPCGRTRKRYPIPPSLPPSPPLTHKPPATQDGKPYIISNAFGPTVADPRSLGYTYVAQTVFRDRADFAYYDERCEAHARLKAWLAGKVEGKPMMTFFEAVPVTGSG